MLGDVRAADFWTVQLCWQMQSLTKEGMPGAAPSVRTALLPVLWTEGIVVLRHHTNKSIPCPAG